IKFTGCLKSLKLSVTWGAVLCTSVRLFSLLSRSLSPSTGYLVSDWAMRLWVGLRLYKTPILRSIALSGSLAPPLSSSHTPSPLPVGPTLGLLHGALLAPCFILVCCYR